MQRIRGALVVMVVAAWALARVVAVHARPMPAAVAAATPLPTPTAVPRPGGKEARPWPVQGRFTIAAQVTPEAEATPLPAWLPPAYPLPWAPTPHDHFFFGRVFPPSFEDIPIADYRFAARDPESGRVHGGIDIPAPLGTPVLAVGAGRVVWAGEGFTYGREREGDPYGLAVVIRHQLGWQGKPLYTLYAHMEAVWVQPGQWVAQGTPLGLVGSTGRSEGPHVHLEVRMQQADEVVQYAPLLNPELWIAPPIGWGVLVGQVYDTHGRLWDFGRVIIEPLDWTPEVQALWQGRHVIWTHTYGRSGGILADPYYQENFALNNLPAGRYRLVIEMDGHMYKRTVMVYPGRVTFFIFTPEDGFTVVQ